MGFERHLRQAAAAGELVELGAERAPVGQLAEEAFQRGDDGAVVGLRRQAAHFPNRPADGGFLVHARQGQAAAGGQLGRPGQLGQAGHDGRADIGVGVDREPAALVETGVVAGDDNGGRGQRVAASELGEPRVQPAFGGRARADARQHQAHAGTRTSGSGWVTRSPSGSSTEK